MQFYSTQVIEFIECQLDPSNYSPAHLVFDYIENRVHQSKVTREIANIAIKSRFIIVFKVVTLPADSRFLFCFLFFFLDDDIYI